LSIMGGTLVLRAPEEFIQSERGRFFQHLHENEIGDLAGGREHAVRLLIGTDNPEPAGVGASHHEEMQALRIAGFTPLEVIDIATRKAAMALGIDHAVGSLEQGKLADIILLDHDPLEDIANTTSIWRVIKGGRVFDPDELKPESQR